MAEVKAETGAPVLRPRPLSPHLQIWRWHVTMATSILHRVTGCGLYVGGLILVGWAVALASGPDAYATYVGLLGSPLGKLVLFGLTLCVLLPHGQRRPAPGVGHGQGLPAQDRRLHRRGGDGLRRRRHHRRLGPSPF